MEIASGLDLSAGLKNVPEKAGYPCKLVHQFHYDLSNQVGSSLREELMVTKNELQRTTKALEVSNKQKADREESANNLQLQSNLTEEEKAKMKKDEKALKETISKLETTQAALNKNVEVNTLFCP